LSLDASAILETGILQRPDHLSRDLVSDDLAWVYTSIQYASDSNVSQIFDYALGSKLFSYGGELKPYLSPEQTVAVLGLTMRAPERIAAWLREDTLPVRPSYDHRLWAWWSAIEIYNPVIAFHDLVTAVAILAGTQDAASPHAEYKLLAPLEATWSPAIYARFRNSRQFQALHLLSSRTTDLVLQADFDHRLSVLIAQTPALVADHTPWLLAEASTSADELLVTAALEDEHVRDALTSLSTSVEDNLRPRVNGLSVLMSRDDNARLGANAMAWALDRSIFKSPRALHAPTSTWLGDLNVEQSVRDIGQNLSEELVQKGTKSEEHLTGALLQLIVDRLTIFNTVTRKTSPEHLSLSATLTNKRDEKVIGNDVALLLEVDTARLRTKLVHLAQVKHSKGRDKPTWSIDIAQLEKILKRDESATYWLLDTHARSKVLCIPGRFLWGIVGGLPRRSREQKTFSVSYYEMRDASVGLGEILSDLFVGMWLGTSSAETLKYVDGSSQTREPINVLKMRFTDRDL
jgi:hypothetical protein